MNSPTIIDNFNMYETITGGNINKKRKESEICTELDRKKKMQLQG